MTKVCAVDEHSNRRRLAPSCPRQTERTIRILMITFRRMEEKTLHVLEIYEGRNHLIPPIPVFGSNHLSPRLHRKYATASTRLKSSHSFQDEKLLEESNGLIIVDERVKGQHDYL
ncbi:unnamed protein product [Wuchereria bancrofti]|uniref:Uncharacterized protein n=1 Tax=Wuchereria bancrofti TaxID=6293 RepID=A0A3P7FBD4_WUCBA|nr:unnamed protein product [Wuchereria bancrofti]